MEQEQPNTSRESSSRNTALGGPTTEVLSETVNMTRISGAGVLEAGSYSSEMKRISGVEKDLR